ncbi:unnamed protein product [Plutella xylostella]|uniref:(diamondback moth) hypothetical protein n=1 Tax=Plutella xylostella TaxID=51655 RepID=A0A8S4GGM1_PLUXY|nr:unnamed protein product [Plutella xylostella]
MAWMTVNEVFHDEITRLNSNLMPPGFRGDAQTIRIMQEGLVKWIDTLGEMSSIAQGLNKTITSADKLQMSPTHTLYLLKDANDDDRSQITEPDNGVAKIVHERVFDHEVHCVGLTNQR